ncbi:uncharacterized protein ARMOST_20425 [Armillaria ostoyae]|uniref:Uncharacterized protein n=1 Tax=Armillaria ostoyae TaxID=47428 RepID=A0A284S7B3_ARMOS|nr:uncharacterized protein ARMOST_20425 [Armillaria ostoyae]
MTPKRQNISLKTLYVAIGLIAYGASYQGLEKAHRNPYYRQPKRRFLALNVWVDEMSAAQPSVILNLRMRRHSPFWSLNDIIDHKALLRLHTSRIISSGENIVTITFLPKKWEVSVLIAVCEISGRPLHNSKQESGTLLPTNDSLRDHKKTDFATVVSDGPDALLYLNLRIS